MPISCLSIIFEDAEVLSLYLIEPYDWLSLKFVRSAYYCVLWKWAAKLAVFSRLDLQETLAQKKRSPDDRRQGTPL